MPGIGNHEHKEVLMLLLRRCFCLAMAVIYLSGCSFMLVEEKTIDKKGKEVVHYNGSKSCKKLAKWGAGAGVIGLVNPALQSEDKIVMLLSVPLGACVLGYAGAGIHNVMIFSGIGPG
jgi:uncharacterized protein YceK